MGVINLCDQFLEEDTPLMISVSMCRVEQESDPRAELGKEDRHTVQMGSRASVLLVDV